MARWLERGETWAILASLAYTASALFNRVGVQVTHLAVGVTLRALPLALLSIFLILSSERRRSQIRRGSNFLGWGTLLLLLINGSILYHIGNPLILEALRLGGVTITTPTSATSNLWAAILATLFLGEVFTRRILAGMLVLIAGIATIAWGQTQSVAVSPAWPLAIVLALSAAWCWAGSGIILARTTRRGLSLPVVLGIGAVWGILVLNGYLAVSEGLDIYLRTPPQGLLAFTISGLLDGFALTSITKALSLTPVAKVVSLSSLQQGLGPLLAFLILADPLNLIMAGGIAVVMVGAIVVQTGRAAIKTRILPATPPAEEIPVSSSSP
ncbi:MAG: DMT family transporter [Chloroflexi bacterium]|nr:DMT family transporter [Chloroflexota bacterium]